MRNNFIILILILTLNIFLSFKIHANEIFNFDVTEAEILDEGNIFLGKKGGTATAKDGTTISATNFKYNKILNILYAQGDVVINDFVNNLKIFTEDLTYLKNTEIIFTKSRAKAKPKAKPKKK